MYKFNWTINNSMDTLLIHLYLSLNWPASVGNVARFILAWSKSIEAWEKCHQLLCPGGFVSFDWPCTSFKFKTSASRTWLRMDGARNYFNILVNGSGVAELGNSLKNALKRIFGRLQVIIILLSKSCRAMYVDRMLLTCTNWCLDWYWLMLSKCVFPSAFTTWSLQDYCRRDILL